VGTVWLTGENGAELSFSEPLPPVIAAQVARGILRPAVTQTVPVVPDTGAFETKLEAAQETAEPDRPRRPSARSSAAAWRAYAVSQGMPKGRAAAMTKASLRTEFSRLRAVS
jgi:hypothetical protein